LVMLVGLQWRLHDIFFGGANFIYTTFLGAKDPKISISAVV